MTTEDLDQQSPGKASLSCGPAFGALDSESRQPGRGRGEAERQFLGSPWGGADGGGLGKWVRGRPRVEPGSLLATRRARRGFAFSCNAIRGVSRRDQRPV